MSRAAEMAMNIGTKTAIGAAIGIGAMMGFSKGIHGHDLSSSFYELTTGDPNIDEGVFGTNVGMLEFLTPIGGNWNPNRVSIAQHGGPLRGSGLPRLLSGIRSGLINGTTVGDLSRNNNRPIANDNLRYANKPPMVDGSLVFGQYNSRFG